MRLFRKKRNTKIYMDYAAATPVSESVLDAMQSYWSQDFYNPSALYQSGVDIRKDIESARTTIAKFLECQSHNIIFTPGGTASDNLAIQGVLDSWRQQNPKKKPHVITSTIEHAAVRDLCLSLQKKGVIELTVTPVNSEGIIDLGELRKVLQENTVVVSIGYVNSEIGVIQPMSEIAKAIRHFKKKTFGSRDVTYPLLHTDAIAAPQYCDVRPAKIGVDMMSLSAAKIYGPKGIALLYVKNTDPLDSIIIGGGQERGLYAGTENVPLIVGFSQAFKDITDKQKSEKERLLKLQKYFFESIGNINKQLKKQFSFEQNPVRINGSLDQRTPNNINISVDEIPSDQLVIELDSRGVMASSRAACSEKDEETSYVLAALGAPTSGEIGTVRFTMGQSTTKKDITTTCRVLGQVLEKIYTTHELFRDTM